MDVGRKKTSLAMVCGFLALALPVLYVLSVGPAALLLVQFDTSTPTSEYADLAGAIFELIYSPLCWGVEATHTEQYLEAYWQWWGYTI